MSDLLATEVDVKSLWSIGHAVFQHWFLGTTLLAKPALLLSQARLTRPAAILAGGAISLASFLCVAIVPTGVLTSEILLEGLLEPALSINASGAVGWIYPTLLTAVFATLLDLSLLYAFHKRIIDLALLSGLFLVNVLCIAIAAYRLIAYVSAHPPEA